MVHLPAYTWNGHRNVRPPSTDQAKLNWAFLDIFLMGGENRL